MKSNRSKMFVSNLTLTLILLVGCTGIKAGQVKGKIVDEAGAPVQASVFLALRVGDAVNINSDLSVSTDNGGNFKFIDVPPGEYVLVVLYLGFGMQPTAATDDNGNTVVVVITPEQGVNLGTITLAKK
jgi:Carboxypeptidase regulatory-like domain